MTDIRRTGSANVAHFERRFLQPAPVQPRRIHKELAPQAGVSAEAVARLANRPGESAIGKRLDEFQRRMQGPYRIGGRTVQVRAAFRSLHGVTEREKHQALRAVETEIGKKKFDEIAPQVARALSSRGTPEDIRVTTQALIDAGAAQKVLALNPRLSPQQAIRFVMHAFRIGLDCRGYVYRAFLDARGSGGMPANSAAYFEKNEGSVLFQHENRLRQVELGAARAGDIVRLKPDEDGRDHNVIVRSSSVQQVPSSGKVTVAGRVVPQRFLTDGWPNGAKPSVRVLTVDSSWGGDDKPLQGGAKREVWLQNEKNGLWGYWDAKGDFQISSGPYGHELDGVFRPRSEP
jgi:hypothetical protein